MAATAAPPDAFPRGTYAKYKRATSYFLQWLLRACPVGSSDVDAKPPLDVYDAIVDAIAHKPTVLTPSALRVYRRALDACASAITLRTRVAEFLGDAADHAHAHFLGRLRTWFQKLQNLELVAPIEVLPTNGDKPLDFTNYYDVLEVPDDYFDEAKDQGDEDAVTKPLVPRATRERLAADAFERDFVAELGCMLMELEELSEAVYSAFYDVRCEKKSLLEAAVVTKVAIDCAASVIGTFQARHPTVRDAPDLVKLLQDQLSREQIERLVESVTTAWTPTPNPQYQYVRGTILVDVVGITRALNDFSKLWNARNFERFDGWDPVFKIKYEEHTSPEFVVPDWSGQSPFLRSQLPRLFNFLTEVANIKKDVLSFCHYDARFLSQFEMFRDTDDVPIALVFLCTCWIRSVAALQGKNKSLGRSVSAAFMHLWDLQERLGACQTDNKLKKLVAQKLFVAEYISPLMRANPVLAGFAMLDNHVQYLALGSDELFVTPFRALSHIYSAFKDIELLDAIPFMEDAIHTYEESLVSPSRAAATHGAYAQTFLTSQQLMLKTAALKYGKETSKRAGHARSIAIKARLVTLSRVVRMVNASDFSVLPSHASASWTSLLSAVATVCREEFFQSRLLSRDTLRLCGAVTSLCHILRDELGRQSHYDRMLTAMSAPLALENAVTFPLLPFLDALHRDDLSLPLSSADELRGDALFEAASKGSTAPRLAFCRRAAAVLASYFGHTSQIERIFHTVPPTPAWVSREFGTLKAGTSGRNVSREFHALMKILETSRGPLREDQLDEFKSRVRATPGVLEMSSSDPTVELCTLFHLAAAGPAHDHHLVEWLIQMGALDHEPPHFRNQNAVASRGTLCNTLAVHSAAMRSRTGTIIRHILEAGNFRDLDTPTYFTKESLAHLVVRANNRRMWQMLYLFGASMTGIDASGKHVWELTTTPEWRDEIKEKAKREQSKKAKREQPTKATRDQTVDELVACADSSTPLSTAGKKKRKKKKKASGAAAGASTVADIEPDLQDKLARLSCALDQFLVQSRGEGNGEAQAIGHDDTRSDDERVG